MLVSFLPKIKNRIGAKLSPRCLVVLIVIGATIAGWLSARDIFVGSIPNGDNLVMHLRFDGDVYDYSGYDNDGRVDGTGYGADSKKYGAQFTTGKIGQGMLFDSSLYQNYLIIDSPQAELDIDEDDVRTFNMWINISEDVELGKTIALLSKTLSSSYYYFFQLVRNNTDGKAKIHLRYKNGTDTENVYSNSSVPVGEWAMVSVVIDKSANTIDFYVNGVHDSQSAITITGTWSNSQSMRIGSANGLLFDGALDELMIFNKALTAEEIAELYNWKGYDEEPQTTSCQISNAYWNDDAIQEGEGAMLVIEGEGDCTHEPVNIAIRKKNLLGEDILANVQPSIQYPHIMRFVENTLTATWLGEYDGDGEDQYYFDAYLIRNHGETAQSNTITVSARPINSSCHCQLGTSNTDICNAGETNFPGCGNGICEEGESRESCYYDCGPISGIVGYQSLFEGAVASNGMNFDQMGDYDYEDFQNHAARLKELWSYTTNHNSISPNAMQPARGSYWWQTADLITNWTKDNNLSMVGGPVAWEDEGTDRIWPQWFKDLSIADKRTVLEERVRAIVDRYKDDSYYWYTVNHPEIDNDDDYIGTGWTNVEAITNVFKWAKEEDPDSLLWINPGAGATGGSEEDRVVKIINDAIAAGAPIDAIGFQSHLSLGTTFSGLYMLPRDEFMDEVYDTYSSVGLPVLVTEFDFSGPKDALLSKSFEGYSDWEDYQADAYKHAYEYFSSKPYMQGIIGWTIWNDNAWVRNSGYFSSKNWWPKPVYSTMKDYLRQECTNTSCNGYNTCQLPAVSGAAIHVPFNVVGKYASGSEKFYDVSGNNHHVQCSASSCPMTLFTGGHDNLGAYQFRDYDKLGDKYVYIADYENTAGEISISSWIRPLNYTRSDDLVGSTNPSNGSSNWVLRQENQGFAFYVYHADGGITVSKKTDLLTSDNYTNFYHVSGTWDGTKTSLYINGELVDQDTATTGSPIAATDLDILIGYKAYARIDDVSIFNRSLSLEEIQTLAEWEESRCDQDLDGYENSECGGDDCNDSDPNINPKAKDYCSANHQIFDMNCESDDNDEINCEEDEYCTDENPCPLPATENLILHLPFDDNILDVSGKDQTATNIGGVTFANGKVGKAASFDGVNDLITLGADSDFNFGSGSFTLSAWIKPTYSANPSESKIFLKGRCVNNNGSDCNGNANYSLSISSRLDSNIKDDNGNSVYNIGVSPGVFGWNGSPWVHAVMVVDRENNIAKVYQNTWSVSDYDISGLSSEINPYGSFLIGSSGGANWYKGLIDEVMVFNKALSEEEVGELFHWNGQTYSSECTTDANCSDNVFCNGAEVCYYGICRSGTAPTVDDGSICTTDACNEEIDQVTHTVNTEILDDDCSLPADDLVLYLPFEDDTTDNSAYNHPVAIVGDSALASGEGYDGGGALILDGSGDYLTISENNNLDIGSSGAKTLTMWTKIDSEMEPGSTYGLMLNGLSAPNYFFELVRQSASDSDAKIYMRSSNGVTVENTASNYSVPVGEWAMIVSVIDKDAKTIDYYVNGVHDSQSAITMTDSWGSDTDTKTRIGYANGLSYKGQIDDLRIYDKALSATEIANLYVCSPNWSCTSWSTCLDGQQTRTCTDVNNCGVLTNKPAESQNCDSNCVENWACASWSTCLNGQQTRTCVDNNSCGTVENRPPLSQDCTIDCSPHWTCSDWLACSNSQQARTCSDANNCGISTDKPAEVQSCNENSEERGGNNSVNNVLITEENQIQTLYKQIILLLQKILNLLLLREEVSNESRVEVEVADEQEPLIVVEQKEKPKAKVPTVVSNSYSFDDSYRLTSDLKIGSRGKEVKFLQIKLNKLGYIIAESGLGSPSHETDYFGSSTERALIKYQIEEEIILSSKDPNAGLLGPKTRESLNEK